MEASEGSPSWQSFYQVDVGKEELKMLECIDPLWRATHWLQVAVQGIAREEVPWYELVTLLTSGAEGAALSLAKHLLTAWQWSIKVCGEDDCPTAPTVLNISQFMTEEETAGGCGRARLVHGLFLCITVGGQGGPQEEMGMACEGGSGSQSLPARACLLARNWHGPHSGQHKSVGSPLQGPYTIKGKMAPSPTSLLSWMSWQSRPPV